MWIRFKVHIHRNSAIMGTTVNKYKSYVLQRLFLQQEMDEHLSYDNYDLFVSSTNYKIMVL